MPAAAVGVLALTAASAEHLPANSIRIGLVLTNDGPGEATLRFGDLAAVAKQGILLKVDAAVVLTQENSGSTLKEALQGISNTTANVSFHELIQ